MGRARGVFDAVTEGPRSALHGGWHADGICEGPVMANGKKKTHGAASRLFIGALVICLSQGMTNRTAFAENQSIPEQIKHLIELKRSAEGYELGLLHPPLPSLAS